MNLSRDMEIVSESKQIANRPEAARAGPYH